MRNTVALAWLVAFGVIAQAAAADAIDVELDRAEIVRLPDRVATLIIGNPSVADGTLQTGGLLIVTGKGFGTTNVIALDAKGEVLAEHTVTVRAPRDGTLTVWRGAGRETWSCAPRCERSVMLGDAPEFFDSVVGQTGARNGHAAGQAPAGGDK
ncbi:MAG: pilus assembly protein N-terminal domain-containing protein [Xanthobacteraceae bacterium]